jgi:hypothetical protein
MWSRNHIYRERRAEFCPETKSRSVTRFSLRHEIVDPDQQLD